MSRALFIDPGLAVGWGILTYGDEPLSFQGGEMPYEQFIDAWGQPSLDFSDRSMLRRYYLNRVVMEGFKVGPKSYQVTPTDAQLWSVKLIGIVETWARWAHLPFETQMPSAMDFDKSGAKIKKLGWWAAAEGVTGEAGHRRSAAKHALKWGVDHNVIPRESLL